MSEIVKVSENWYRTEHSNTDLFYRVWSPSQRIPSATVIFLHGFGEHTGRYLNIFEKFAQNGIKVVSFDQRGHGETGKKTNSLGHGNGLKVLFQDIDEFIEKFNDPIVDLILMGHSYGGLAAFNYAINGRNRNLLNGLIGCSSGFEIPKEILPNSVGLFILRNLVKIFPNQTIKLNVDPAALSRNEEVNEIYGKDPLVTPRCTISYLNDGLVPKYIQTSADKIHTPNILITHGTADKVTLSKGSQDVYEALKDIKYTNATLKLYEGGYHELHNDLIRDEVLNDYIQWIKNLQPYLIQSKL